MPQPARRQTTFQPGTAIKLGNMLRRDFRVMVRDARDGGRLSQFAAEFSKRRLATMIQQGIASPNYLTKVDGRLGAREETVRIPGQITYLFHRIAEATAFGLSFLRHYSIKGETRAYSESWTVIANGAEYRGPLERLPADTEEVILVSPAPYSRRLEQTHGIRRGDPRYQTTEFARAAIKKAFPAFRTERRFVSLSGLRSSRWVVPYMVQRPPGGPMVYPAVVISVR